MQWVLRARQENGLQGESPVPGILPWAGLTEKEILSHLSFRHRSKAGLTLRITPWQDEDVSPDKAQGSQQNEAGGLAGGIGDKTCIFVDKNKLLDSLAEQCSIQHMGVLAPWERK
ncbi:hypothetical protein DUI87_14918 [Hirundo rustica rustica]|uniref:Uncharacterized protein n=1 Tax=Hirundo rustica rustica TaxID=333673 RepID=A0A3M0KC67_HIRRU|nr:hypothetical protein DUI87_14918 [Hirundo rustica rustica]